MPQTIPYFLLVPIDEGTIQTLLPLDQRQKAAEALFQQLKHQITQVTPEQVLLFDDRLASSFKTEAEPPRFFLQRDLWVDLGRGEILQGSTIIPLTGREMRVLGRLLCQPNRYINTKMLAEGIVSEESFDPGHCIEETIYKLRRKLGEDAAKPRLLRCRREIGYGIFPDPLPHQAKVSQRGERDA
jgi:DNA-binding response OmpR family regulator